MLSSVSGGAAPATSNTPTPSGWSRWARLWQRHGPRPDDNPDLLVATWKAAWLSGAKARWEALSPGANPYATDYLVYPRLIRHGMHLSTVAVILTVWLGAVLAGAAGVVLAIPVAGFLSVSMRHWREYREIERLTEAAK